MGNPDETLRTPRILWEVIKKSTRHASEIIEEFFWIHEEPVVMFGECKENPDDSLQRRLGNPHGLVLYHIREASRTLRTHLEPLRNLEAPWDPQDILKSPGRKYFRVVGTSLGNRWNA